MITVALLAVTAMLATRSHQVWVPALVSVAGTVPSLYVGWRALPPGRSDAWLPLARRFRGGIVWLTVSRDVDGPGLAVRIGELIAAGGSDKGLDFTGPEQAGRALGRVLSGRGRCCWWLMMCGRRRS